MLLHLLQTISINLTIYAKLGMGSTYLLSILLYMFIISIIFSTGDEICYETGNFTRNSEYEKNRNAFLSSLATNVEINGGFYMAVLGQLSDRVYARAVCRGDSSNESCASCVSSATDGLIADCPNQKEALSWGSKDSPCFVRYGNYSFFRKLELEPWTILYNTGRFTMTGFNQTWENLTSRMVLKASSSEKKFATEKVNVTDFVRTYALMQCTPDLSQSDCEICLRTSVAQYQACCNGYRGGIVQIPTCIFRWEMYPFYNAPESPSPSPPIPPGTSSPSPPIAPGRKGSQSQWIVVGTVVSAILVIVLFGFFFFRIWRRKNEEEARRRAIQLLFSEDDSEHNILSGENHVESQDFPLFSLGQILEATQDFSSESKLGEGGFGPVYKGILADGKEIAVKRLSRRSGQGLKEFKNEVILIAKLQHKNLVRLLGYCLEGKELLLIYEYMPNKSLDMHLFDSTWSAQLDWKRRISIINGIARGLLYLHEDSRLKIIHRDLKTSNILLNHEMNPKISDFGMARIFGGNQNEANTIRVVGTYGYMAPEYAMDGIFSVKSDVFSFGVLLLEIISGKKNIGFHLSETGRSLLAYAWKLWCEGNALELMDPVLSQSYVPVEVMKFIHIGLLCVQEDPTYRPTMSSVVFMLVSDNVTLPKPSQPAFSIVRVAQSVQSSLNGKGCSVNEVTFSSMTPR